MSLTIQTSEAVSLAPSLDTRPTRDYGVQCPFVSAGMGFVAYPLSFTPRVPYTMPQFRAVVPTPGTTGSFDLLGFPAGEDSVRKIKDVRPAAEIIAEMMTEAREILGEELTEMSGRA